MLGCIPAMFWLKPNGAAPTVVIGSFAMMTLALFTLGYSRIAILFVILAFATYAFSLLEDLALQWLYPNELFQPISEHRRWRLLCR